MGSCGDYLYDGWIAYLCGALIGVVSVLLFEYSPRLLDKFHIHDVAGVLNLHGIPGIIGGLLSAIFRAKYVDDNGGVQVAGVGISVGIGLLGGLIVGALTKPLHHYESNNRYFNDLTNVALEEFVEAELEVYGGPHSNHAQTLITGRGDHGSRAEIVPVQYNLNQHNYEIQPMTNLHKQSNPTILTDQGDQFRNKNQDNLE